MADILNDHGSNLVAFWELEEASGARADSFASFDLSDIGGVGSVAGIQGNCADFSGSNLLERVHETALEITANNDKTITFWMRGAISIGVNAYLFHKWSGGKNFLIRANDSAGHIQFYLGDSGGGTGGLAEGTTNVLDGSWHFIVVTYDGSDNKGRVYVDGNATPEGVHSTAQSPTSQSGGSIFVGAENTTNQSLDGQMDEIGVWDRLLSTSEMSAIYNSGAGIPYDDGGGGGGGGASPFVQAAVLG